MTKYLIPSIILSGALLLLAGALFVTQTPLADGNGYIGFPAYLQSATTTTVGTDTTVTLFASVADCKSRVVTTNNDAIHLSFGDATGFGSTTISTVVGHYQAASTTVAYESGIYGCGLMAARGLTASGTVTISNF